MQNQINISNEYTSNQFVIEELEEKVLNSLQKFQEVVAPNPFLPTPTSYWRLDGGG